MNVRRSFLWACSAALTVFLIVLLIKISKLDLRVTVQQLKSVSWVSFSRVGFVDRAARLSFQPEMAPGRRQPAPLL